MPDHRPAGRPRTGTAARPGPARAAVLALAVAALLAVLAGAAPAAHAVTLGRLDDTLRSRGFAAPYVQALPGGGSSTESFLVVTFVSEAESEAAYGREVDEIARLVWREAGCPVAKVLVAGTRTTVSAPAGRSAPTGTVDLTADQLRARHGPQDAGALAAAPCWEAGDDAGMSTAGMVAVLLLVVVPALLAGAFAAWLVTFAVMRRGRDRLAAALLGARAPGATWAAGPADDGGPPVPRAPRLPAPALPGDAVPEPAGADGTLDTGNSRGGPGDPANTTTPPAPPRGPAAPGGTS